MSRREELLDAACDHALEHGLIGLTLRPLAAALGTSDRMLLYHFHSRDDLVSAIVQRSTDRSVGALSHLRRADSAADAVRALWAGYRREPLRGCVHLYTQAAATGLLGTEPWRSEARAGNARWTRALCAYLADAGVGADRVERTVALVDSALLGFHLDLATESTGELDAAVEDLARAAQALADGVLPQG